ncbi:putative toxin biosynthesis protein [Delitschia confertaspora ATCC 74209]|uniref:Toxin biosynthesis protein n=1 Tax=Delitschia confertaspora ATCC 74209 TaxID=1513339 RepID=A0A9P4JYZ0_9PLEO|nr:putative toxin biosynthesis protein [Delitschia confertaspora ATCC 74209]
MATYAVLGATGRCGTALIETISLDTPSAKINAYCRNKAKLLHCLPQIESSCSAVFLVVSTNDNIPGCSMAQETAFGNGAGYRMPKLVLLSSATLDDQLSCNTPWLVRQILFRSASNVYDDLRKAESFLRGQEDWAKTIFIKPGGLSVDVRKGHALSFIEEKSPLSYLDLAAAMIEAADDAEGKYDMRNVGVIYTDGEAKFPSGAPMCFIIGLLRHYFPLLHPYLPAKGP